MRVSGGMSWLRRATLLALGLCAGWAGARQTQATSTPPPEIQQTALVEGRDIGATVVATGVVRARVGAQVTVGSRASGVLRKLYVNIGDRVRAGQLLAELDATQLETQVARADALRLNAVAERSFAESEFARTQRLAEQNVATAAQLAEARRRLDTSIARENEALAALAEARVQRDYTRIRAPIAGVVATVATQEGETVAASFAAPTFVTIVDLARLEVWAYVDETDIGRVHVGQRVQLTVDSYPDEVFAGRVSAIRPTAELRDDVVNYVTLIDVEQRAALPLRPEMTATVRLLVENRAVAAAVPNSALRRDGNGAYVLTPAATGPVRRDVQLGSRGTDYTEITAGLTAGERVVIGAVPCVPSTPNGTP